ncbi:MAG TPA: RNA polymerase sigma factor [Cyclobacteriaceae bacterium]|nr:RNA polymerase sigma factor [Cyclobacteriaceae bacterium]
MTETELVERCKRGDRTGQRLLYDKYIVPMTRLCYRYIGDSEATKDILADAFMNIFDRIHQFQYRGEGSLTAWIHRIVVNQALMWLRSNKSLVLRLEDQDVVVSTPETPISSLQAEDLYNLICQLPTGYRTVFNLYAIEGYSHEEIATRLGITESASRSQLTRARQYLLALLNKPNT